MKTIELIGGPRDGQVLNVQNFLQELKIPAIASSHLLDLTIKGQEEVAEEDFFRVARYRALVADPTRFYFVSTFVDR